MWWRLLTIACYLALPAPLALAVDFPYTAYVNSADVYVRSGPGRDYYPTDKLQKGERIEVYRHDPGGWLAIRPPRGSYSWVSARHLDPEQDKLAVVNSDRVVARVGSTFNDARDVIQVRLDRGEKVELLEPPSPDSPWCKIAPPAGEFRWVFAKYLDRELPPDLAADAEEAGVPAAGGSESPASRRGARSADALDPETRALVTSELERLRELERIDAEISEIVAEDISQWSFEDLQHRAEYALRAAQGSLERGRARILLDKLARFDDVKQRHDALQQGPLPTAVAAQRPIAIPNRTTEGRYDGVGRLSPVVSKKTGGPQYALLDESGQVLSFVTPAPGVNLRPFVDRYVGVTGQRGYLTDLHRQHVSVQRVTLLEAGTADRVMRR